MSTTEATNKATDYESNNGMGEWNLNSMKFDASRYPGLTIKEISQLRIKFCVKPCFIAPYISKNLTFKFTLKYYKDHWKPGRNSIPVNYRLKVYNKFYEGRNFKYNNGNVFEAIKMVYEIISIWAENDSKYRQHKFWRYLQGEDLELDSVDEEFFLTKDEIMERRAKKKQIWKRMEPPERMELSERNTTN